MELKKSYLFLLSLATGVLLGLSFVPHLTLLSFIGFVPLFFLESLVLNSDLKKKKASLFWLSYLSFLIWNVMDTWWLVNASFGGAIMAFTCNALLMSFTYFVYLFSTHKIKSNYKVLLFIPFWLTFEYLHTDWDLSWTWLTLGNVFAFKPEWIQWYEYTGVSGGSLWVLVVNSLCYLSVMEFKNYDIKRKAVLVISIILVIYSPTQVSEFVEEHYLAHSPGTQTIKSDHVNVVVVQPSYDPYTEKFDVPFRDQFNEMLEIVAKRIDSTTDYLVLPETFIVSTKFGHEPPVYESSINSHESVAGFYDSLFSKYPHLNVVTGADTYYEYAPGEEHLATSRSYANSPGSFYESFNTALQMSVERPPQVYHKSKLVPGVEMIPFPSVLGSLAIKMGGTSGSLGRQKERDVFIGPKGAVVGPIVCYESVFGEYVAEYIKKGANVLFIITNDAWWGDTPGYKQHLAFGSLRAIETRRFIARSANTGTSCVIDDKGEIHQPTKWYQKTCISYSVPLNNEVTFFVSHGDMLSRFMRWIALGSFITGIFLWIKNRQKEKKRIIEKEKEKLRTRGLERVKKS